jgi:hypothetical protein
LICAQIQIKSIHQYLSPLTPVEGGIQMKAKKLDNRSEFRANKLLVPGVVMLAFLEIGMWGWLASGYIQPLVMFGYIGTSIGVGLGLYAVLPKKRKPIGRRLTLFLVGAFLFGYAVLMGKENSQLEGAIFGLLTGSSRWP